MKRLVTIILVLALLAPTISAINTYEVRASVNEIGLSTQEPKVTVEPERTTEPENTKVPEDTAEPVGSESPEETIEPEITVAPIEYELGDIDGSGKINANDALKVLKHAAKIEILDDSELIIADVDKSGKADATDALYILQYAAKIIVRFVFNPDENIEILKEYLRENSNTTYQNSPAVKYDFTLNGESEYSQEYSKLSYNEKYDSFYYEYHALVDLKNSVNIKYKITDSEIHFDIDIKENDEEKLYSVVASDFFDIKELSTELKVANDTNVTLYKFRTSKRELRELMYEEGLDRINAWFHIGLISMESYLQKTVVMTLKDIGLGQYDYDQDFLLKMSLILNGIYLDGDPDIENALSKLKDYIIANGVKDGNLVYLELSTLNGGSSYADEEEYYNSLVYDSEYDIVYFQKNIIYINPNQYAVAVVQPCSDKTSYCYVDIYEYDNNGNLTYIDSIEARAKSRDICWGGSYEFYYVDESDRKLSAQDQMLGDQIVTDLISDLHHDIFREISDVELYELGYWYYYN